MPRHHAAVVPRRWRLGKRSTARQCTLRATNPSGTTRAIARHLAVLVLLGSLGCGLLPGRGGAPAGDTRPSSGGPPPASDRQPAESAPAAEPPPAPTSAHVEASNDDALSESAYKDA